MYVWFIEAEKKKHTFSHFSWQANYKVWRSSQHSSADRNITFTCEKMSFQKAQEWICLHSLEAKCFVSCEMGNLLKPVFGGSCTQLHSPALIAVQQSDTDKTDLGPVNTLTLDSQHYRLQLSMAHSVMMDTWIIQSRAVVAWDMLPCWRRDKLDTHLLFDNFLNNLQPVTLFLPVTDSAHSHLSITRNCDMQTHASLV